MEKMIVTLEPRKSPIKSARVCEIANDGYVTMHTVKNMPGFRGAAFHKDLLYLASPKSVRSFNRDFQVQEVLYKYGFNELHTIRITLDGKLIVVSTNQNKVFRCDLNDKGREWKDLYTAWSNSHLNTIKGTLVMSLQGKVMDFYTGELVWQSKLFNKTHNYEKILDGSVVFLSENKVVRNEKVIYKEEEKFMRGMFVDYPFLYVGVNSFMDRSKDAIYVPPKVLKMSMEGEVEKVIEIPAKKPWVIYDIIKNEW